MLFRRFRTAKILSQWFEAERSRGAQGPRERPSPSRQVQAFLAGMQVCTPARQSGRRVRQDGVPSRYEAKHAGLGCTLLAAYTGTHCGRIRGMLLGARGHYITKSTVSAALEYRWGTTPDLPSRKAGEPGGTDGSEGHRIRLADLSVWLVLVRLVLVLLVRLVLVRLVLFGGLRHGPGGRGNRRPSGGLRPAFGGDGPAPG
jgi:hypothetical protein